MKYIFLFAAVLLLQSCEVVETIEIRADGSGEISIMQRRDEQSYMKMNPDEYLKEQRFQDETLVFANIMKSQAEVLSKMSSKEQLLYKKFENTSIRVFQNSDTKEKYRSFQSAFTNINLLPDLYKSYEYYDNIVHNYALSAEEHYSDLEFFYDGKTFKRKASIISEVFYKQEMEELAQYETYLKGQSYISNYILKYRFPKAIKSVSNPSAKISKDKKALEIIFSIIEAKKHPEITNFEVVFE